MNRRRIILALSGVAAALALTFSTAIAQAPPNPPRTFYGTVTGGAGHPGIVATVNGITCGNGTVQSQSGEIVYVVSVASDSQKAGCGAPGRTVRFYLTGPAGQPGKLVTTTATWSGPGPALQNLTAGPALTIRGYVQLLASDGPIY
jgi:hypothetical protein